MNRDEELRAIEDAIASGKLRQVSPDCETPPIRPGFNWSATNKQRNKSKKSNSKAREAQYRKLGL